MSLQVPIALFSEIGLPRQEGAPMQVRSFLPTWNSRSKASDDGPTRPFSPLAEKAGAGFMHEVR